MTVPSKFDGNVSSISKHLYSGGYSRDPLPNKDKIYDSLSTHNLLDVPIKRPVITPVLLRKRKSIIERVKKTITEKVIQMSCFWKNTLSPANDDIVISPASEIVTAESSINQSIDISRIT